MNDSSLCSIDYDFRHFLGNTIILLGGRPDIAAMLKKSQDGALTEADIDALRSYNLKLIDGLKTRLISCSTISVKPSGSSPSNPRP